ncbi:MAG TPA: sugar ABC transporter permease [Roseiflexaceae bacterium]|nr:sugar ABC transporter permease [Roseiflexaceae bacterium]
MAREPRGEIAHPSRARGWRLFGAGQTARYRVELGLMLLPFLLGVAMLIGLPAIATLAIAFFSYDSVSPPEWNNFQNFPEIFSERLFWISARNSLLFVALAVPLRILGALALALLLRRRQRGVGLYRVAAYLPTVIPDAAYALIWLWIFNPFYGPLNRILAIAGLPTPAWLAQVNTALAALVIMAAFQIGEGLVVLLAGLQDVPEDYYDSAAIDGAGRWQIFRRITLPLLTPWLLLLTIRDIILSTQNTFTPAWLMTKGGPYYATLFLPMFIYNEAFDRFLFGHAAAMLLVLFLWVGLLLWILYEIVGGWGYAGDV